MCYTYDNLSRVTTRTIKSIADDSVIFTESFTYSSNAKLDLLTQALSWDKHCTFKYMENENFISATVGISGEIKRPNSQFPRRRPYAYGYAPAYACQLDQLPEILDETTGKGSNVVTSHAAEHMYKRFYGKHRTLNPPKKYAKLLGLLLVWGYCGA